MKNKIKPTICTKITISDLHFYKYFHRHLKPHRHTLMIPSTKKRVNYLNSKQTKK